MRKRLLGVSLAVGVLLAGAAAGQDKPAEKAAPAPMDEKAMMEMMQKLATPGEAHKKLDPLIGTWDSKVKMWMDPSKPPRSRRELPRTRGCLATASLRRRLRARSWDSRSRESGTRATTT